MYPSSDVNTMMCVNRVVTRGKKSPLLFFSTRLWSFDNMSAMQQHRPSKIYELQCWRTRPFATRPDTPTMSSVEDFLPLTCAHDFMTSPSNSTNGITGGKVLSKRWFQLILPALSIVTYKHINIYYKYMISVLGLDHKILFELRAFCVLLLLV